MVGKVLGFRVLELGGSPQSSHLQNSKREREVSACSNAPNTEIVASGLDTSPDMDALAQSAS